MNSFVSATENDNTSNSISPKFNYLSTSPDIFKDFYSVLEQEESENDIRLKYTIVMKDIIIKHLEKELKKYERGFILWNSLVNSI
jgi:hypothetical protein